MLVQLHLPPQVVDIEVADPTVATADPIVADIEGTLEIWIRAIQKIVVRIQILGLAVTIPLRGAGIVPSKKD